MSREHSLGTADFWDRIERIRTTLGWDASRIHELLSLRADNADRLRKKNRLPRLSAIDVLLGELGLSYDEFFVGPLDYLELARRLQQGTGYVPERYLDAAYSRRRTSLDVLKYVEKTFGQDALVRTLRQFHVAPSLLDDPDALISLRFLTDLCDHLSMRGVSDESLVEMGKFTTLVNAESLMGRMLSACHNAWDLYDLQINHLMTHYDFNFSYRTLRLTREGCLIEIRENKDVVAELGVTHLGSPRNCLTRIGRAAAVTGFAGLPHSRIIETHCVHRGDPCCILKVDYSEAAKGIRLDS